MPRGFSFGNYKTYRLRRYYLAWIECTLLEASHIVSNPCDRLRILHFMDNLKTPAIEDPGRIPCGDLQKIGKMSRFPDKVACLLVMMRYLVTSWWECSELSPGMVESQLVELDELLDVYPFVVICGMPDIGYTIRLYDDN